MLPLIFSFFFLFAKRGSHLFVQVCNSVLSLTGSLYAVSCCVTVSKCS